MPLTLAWQQIALRLTCAFVAGILIGINRDEKAGPQAYVRMRWSAWPPASR
jgi:hypothetical protein